MKKFSYIIQSESAPNIENLWLHNGKLHYYEGGWKSIEDRVSIEDTGQGGEATIKAPIIKGDSESVKAYNKEHLPTGSFFVAIDYGYGTGTWNSTTGGQAHIVTAYGNTVYYSIDIDGSVAKILESPDLYYEYVQAGGQKSPIQFMLVLKNLIDS